MVPRRAELLVGLAAAVFAVGFAAVEELGAASYASGAVIGAALGLAHRHPRVAWIAVAAAAAATAPLGGLSSGAAILFFGHAFCAGRWDGRWAGVAGLLALVAALELDALLTHTAGVPALILPATGWAAGRALRERELVAEQLAERARELEEEQEAHAALSVRYERARIASELHDIVAHAISVMVVQASAGQRLTADYPEQTAETFDAIAGAAREAEEDMGRLVALLGDENPTGAAPDLALVEELVARASGSGLDVSLRLEGHREGLPPTLVDTAYRVVQEGLTNALRYAAGASVRVLVRGDREGLLVEVTNAPTASERALVGAGMGSGLRGLRERVGACGGRLDAGPTQSGEWLLRARLPRLTRAASAPPGPRRGSG